MLFESGGAGLPRRGTGSRHPMGGRRSGLPFNRESSGRFARFKGAGHHRVAERLGPGLAHDALYLVRPDGYVALADAATEPGRLEAYARRHFT